MFTKKRVRKKLMAGHRLSFLILEYLCRIAIVSTVINNVQKQLGYRIAKWTMQEGLEEFKNQSGWKVAFGILFGYYLISWIMMAVFEPSGSEIVQWDIYWYFYIITSATVGYGDFLPSTLGSRIVTISVIFIGVGTIILLIEQVGATAFKISEKIWRGEMFVKRKDHLLIINYRGDRTKNIFQGLLADKHRQERDLVLCFDAKESNRNPLSAIGKERIGGIKVKDGFEDDSWVQRACVKDAWRVGVDVGDDNLALTLCLMINAINPRAHIAVVLKSMDKYAAKINSLVSPDIECVPDGMVDWLVRALQDKWSTDIIQDISSTKGQTMYNISVPDNFGSCSYELIEKYFENLDTQIIGVSDGSDRSKRYINPSDDFEVTGGMVISYLNENRINDSVFWDQIN